MINSAVRRFILPFSPQKSGEPFNSEIEVAAVYALSELERAKGGGLVVRQPEEKLLFLAEMGYPLWLFPGKAAAFIFDGLNNYNYSVPYIELPDAKVFMDNLEEKSKTQEQFVTFLSDHRTYFQQPAKEKEFSLRNLIDELDFKKEFDIYRKEATEVIIQPKFALLSPSLQETAISSMLERMDKLQFSLKEDVEGLSECINRLNKLTSQYITELSYAAEAVKDEADAKIKAREELVKPQILKLNREYKHEIANVTKNFDEEINKFEKLEAKTTKIIAAEEKKLKLYDHEAKKQAQENHLIYEKKWKTKSRSTKKELNGLKKEQKRTENNIKNLIKQKSQKISKLQLELEAEVKLARQPLLDLEATRDAKMLVFKQETENLQNHEKPLLEGLNDAVKLAQGATYKFQILGIRNSQFRTPALFYIPFYVACYQAGLGQRYLFFAPSTMSSIGFAAKLKGAIGISKVKQMFIPQFKAITVLIERLDVLAKQDSALDRQIIAFGEKNNILNNEAARTKIAKGLAYLKDQGWLSDKQFQVLNKN